MNKIVEIAKEISSGLTPLRSNLQYWANGNIPWLKTEQIGEYRIQTTNEFVSEIALNETGLKLYPKNTISIAMYGEGKTRGNVSILDCPMTTNQACCNIIVNEDLVEPFYLYYFLKTQYHKLRQLSSGVRKNLNSNDIKNYKITLPEKAIQKKIVKTLFNIDEKIELNNKINEELEKLAKTLYDYWFVQFDFPDENGNPYKSSGGKMVWNDELKREIPDGWGVKCIGEIEPNIITGKTPSTKDDANFNGAVPFVTIGDIRGNMYVVKTAQTLSEKGANSQAKKYIPEDAICVTCIASPGLVGFATKESQTNQQINSVICQSEYNKIYLYFAIKDYFVFSSGAKTGNTFDNMNKGDFAGIKLVYPPKEILKKFTNKISITCMKIKNNSIENNDLSSLRDFLLPMLMSGQVTVMDSNGG